VYLLTMPKGYSTTRTTVNFLGYHFIWCPKYRRKVLVGNIPKRLRELIIEKANEIGCEIIALEIMPDHVHLFITGMPDIAPNFIIGRIKGYTSNILRKEFPELVRRIPSLWTRSYFVSTHGHVSDKTIQMYIENQKGK